MSWDVGSWVIDTVNSVLSALIQAHGSQTFTENGTFTVPAGVTKILVTAFGAGGGGALYYGGQGGDRIVKKVYSVTPGAIIPITIGIGGNEEADGGSTVIGNIVTLAGGGRGGVPKNHVGSLGGNAGTSGMDSPVANGGYCGENEYYNSRTYDGGGGGGGGYGRGGNGGRGESSGGTYAGNGDSGGIGAGGGGGGEANSGGRYSGKGGNGGNGIVIIEW